MCRDLPPPGPARPLTHRHTPTRYAYGKAVVVYGFSDKTKLYRIIYSIHVSTRRETQGYTHSG